MDNKVVVPGFLIDCDFALCRGLLQIMTMPWSSYLGSTAKALAIMMPALIL